MKILPNADNVIIPIEKLTKYALNYEGDFNKATAFQKALGYNLNNYGLLIQNIKSNIKNFPAIKKGDLGHGMRYEVIMELTEVNNKKAKVLTAWIDDGNMGDIRLINAYRASLITGFVKIFEQKLLFCKEKFSYYADAYAEIFPQSK